jgi:hypothetical protein
MSLIEDVIRLQKSRPELFPDFPETVDLSKDEETLKKELFLKDGGFAISVDQTLSALPKKSVNEFITFVLKHVSDIEWTMGAKRSIGVLVTAAKYERTPEEAAAYFTAVKRSKSHERDLKIYFANDDEVVDEA